MHSGGRGGYARGRGAGGRGGRGRGGGEPIWMQYKRAAVARRDAADHQSLGEDHGSEAQRQRNDVTGAPRPPLVEEVAVPDLRQHFERMDGGPYPALRDLHGSTFVAAQHDIQVTIHTVQADPFAPPSQVSVSVPFRFSHQLVQDPEADDPTATSALARVALEDALLRDLLDGPSLAPLVVQHPSQHVLERSALAVLLQRDGRTPDRLELRLQVPFAANGRRIDGRECYRRFGQLLLPRVVAAVLPSSDQGFERSRHERLQRHTWSVLDQDYVRQSLRTRGLCGFVANGAILPRASGDSELPLAPPAAVPFAAPPHHEVSFDLPRLRKRITGLGIPRGIVTVVGGAFHGKSTLLRALQSGVYNRVPGDGREFVCVDETACKVRAEDRRSVFNTDVSPFVASLPNDGANTAHFTTPDASGSTSQATNVVEAIQLGCKLLLIDEDTAATNFMVRDAVMAELIPSTSEPIRPFATRTRAFYEHLGVSSVVVCGGTSGMLSVSDVVLAMDRYHCVDVTEKAKSTLAKFGLESSSSNAGATRVDVAGILSGVDRVIPVARAFQADGGDRLRISAKGLWTIRSGAAEGSTIDVSALEQLVEQGQTNAVAVALGCLVQACGHEEEGLRLHRAHEVLRRQLSGGSASNQLLSFESRYSSVPRGFLCMPRIHEALGALLRLRALTRFA